jgi:phosphonopyruvate decarboxylase
MISSKDIINNFIKKKINFFSGVPDSVLKDLTGLFDKKRNIKHVVAVNEGSAISIATGYHLSSNKIPCVYLQNSGLSNAMNPLISIAHKRVYSIPMVLIIGWRGSPKKKDEPQHNVKGKITRNLLTLLNIKYCILRKKKDINKLNDLISYSSKNKTPIACLIEKDIIFPKIKVKKNTKLKNIYRKDFIISLLKNIKKNTKIISTTGYTSRELKQIRDEQNILNGEDFYMVGGMGHSLSVAYGFSINSKKNIICLDGDGSLLMHLGSLRTLGKLGNKNIKHILLNNNSHESVGGQTTMARGINFKNLVKSVGYKKYYKISNKKNMSKNIKKFMNSNGPSFLEVIISNGTINNLSRPKDLIEIKNKFMKKR